VLKAAVVSLIGGVRETSGVMLLSVNRVQCRVGSFTACPRSRTGRWWPTVIGSTAAALGPPFL
jgi:hypothetical protein